MLEFAATASDVVDGPIPAVCAPPSGSTFAPGDTTVTCRATDASGNTGTAIFTIHVKGPDEQLADLQAFVESLPVEKKVAERLKAYIVDVRKHLAAARMSAVCGGLADMTADVLKESGKGLTPEQADRLVIDLARIRTVVGC